MKKAELRPDIVERLSRDRVDPGTVRPVFRVLAIVPAALFWLWFYIVVSSLPGLRAATLQDWWHVVLSAFLAALFSLAALRGYVPRWLWRCIPHSWAWDTRER